jgi:hypothetical protein
MSGGYLRLPQGCKRGDGGSEEKTDEVEVVVFKAYRKEDQRKIGKRSSRFHGAQLLTGTGQKEPLADEQFLFVDQGIDQLKTEAGHPDLIGVWIHQGNGQPTSPLLQIAAFFLVKQSLAAGLITT